QWPREAATFTGHAAGNEPAQRDEWSTYLTLGRTRSIKHGMAYGARALRPRSPRSSPRAGKPPTRRRGTGDLTPNDDEVCVMQRAEVVLDVYRHRPGTQRSYRSVLGLYCQ